jgi:hypothetical protein
MASMAHGQTKVADQGASASISPEIVEAWQKAGFRLQSGYWPIHGQDRKLVPLPTFAIEVRSRPARDPGFISGLPQPEVPFGLSIRFAEGSSADTVLAEVGSFRPFHCLTRRSETKAYVKSARSKNFASSIWGKVL